MADETTIPRGSSARAPDLNWSQVRETVLMLELSAVQIEAAMTESNSSVDVLTKAFTSMADCMSKLSETVRSLPDHPDIAAAKSELTGKSEHVSGMVHQAVIAFQFYDKLAQRLVHVGHSLGSLSNLVSDQAKLYNPNEWVALQNQIKSKYTMVEEVAMFDAVMHGVPVHEAVSRYMADMKQKGDDIELF